MATIVALASGNWSAGGTWTGGVKPGSGDTAQSGAFTVTIDEDVTCTMIEATSTGWFTCSTTRAITADIKHSGSNTANGALELTHTSGSTVTINGNLLAMGGSTNNRETVNNTSTGALVVNGDVSGGAGTSSVGIYNASTGTVDVTGDVTGTGSNTSVGIAMFGTGTVTVVGNVTGGTGANAAGINNESSGTLVVTGNATGGSNTAAHGINNKAAGTVTINGNAIGGWSGTGVYGLRVTSSANATINGNAIGGSGGTRNSGVFSSSTGTVTLTGIAIGGTSTSAGAAAGAEGQESTSPVNIYRAQYGAEGQSPTAGFVKLIKDADNSTDFLCTDSDRRELVLARLLRNPGMAGGLDG